MCMCMYLVSINNYLLVFGNIFTMNKAVSWLVRNFPKILGWILYLGLFAISIFFSWEVLQKFNSQAMSFSQSEEIIKVHPTVTICSKRFSYKMSKKYYWNDFNITYSSGGLISRVIKVQAFNFVNMEKYKLGPYFDPS